MNFNLDLDHADEIEQALLYTLRDRKYINGPQLAKFERAWADFNDLPYAVGVGSGTDAIRLALLALGVKPGDKVISPALNAAWTAQAALSIGAKAVFVDVKDDTLLMDTDDLRHHMDAKAIIPVHLYGQMVDMEAVASYAREFGLVMVEDCAQSHGAFYDHYGPGVYSDAAIYSHYPTKNLGCLGDGGSVLTRLPFVAEQVRLMRDAGRTDRYVHLIPGINSMLDEIQAAVLNVRLKHLYNQNKKRALLAERYRTELAGVGDLKFTKIAPKAHTVNHLFVVRTCEREDLIPFLKVRDIPALCHYPCAMQHQPFVRAAALDQGEFPVAAKAAAQVVSLPLWPSMSEAEQSQVIAAVREFYGA